MLSPTGQLKLTARGAGLPKGLPDWFVEKANSDGQVTMADYTKNWTQDAVAKFDRYDPNHDGVITAEECLPVEKGKSSRSDPHSRLIEGNWAENKMN